MFVFTPPYSQRRLTGASSRFTAAGSRVPVRGLWIRGERFYAQLTIGNPVNGEERVRRVPLVDTRDVKSRVAEALRLAAQSLWRAQNYFGDLSRRWKARLRSPKAITAMAHKLARILWHLLKYKQAFNPEVFAKEAQKMQRKRFARLHNMAATLNYRLVPNQ